MRGVILLGGLGPVRNDLFDHGLPVLTTWQAADRVDNTHRLWFGRPGVWGMRMANQIMGRADKIFNVGSRLSVWTVGYGEVIRGKVSNDNTEQDFDWLDECASIREKYPLVESPTHDDPPGGIHPYRFVQRLQDFLSPDEVVVTDMGTALTSAHQVLRLKPPQRLMTSGGLGEMGCSLPAAVGVSFARNKGRVVCLQCDGGMMLNLQELATIAHHQLPIKIIVFDNKGYTMIRQTQRLAGYDLAGVSPETGVTTPDFRRLAHAWGFAACDVTTWEEFGRAIPALFERPGPAVVVYHFPPEIDLLPKLMPIRNADGTITTPKFSEMSP
jgi:acetolactate synthase-1/2/3 large subunit